MLGWYGEGVAMGAVLVADEVVYVALFGVQGAWMWVGEVGMGPLGSGKQYWSISFWQPSEKSSSLKPFSKSASMSQQYCVSWGMSDDCVSLKLAVDMLRVLLGSSVGVYHDVVKFAAVLTAEAVTHVAKIDDVLV